MTQGNGSYQAALVPALQAFKERFRTPDFVEALAIRIDRTPEHSSDLLETYLAETDVGLSLIAPYLEQGQRILEVGAGMGLLSVFLAEKGYCLTALEPDARGFGFMTKANTAVSERVDTGENYSFIGTGAEHLSPDRHGLFDLIFSVHVLEHVVDLPAAMASMTGVLAPGGRMVHLCPNYAVPYEPHLAIPLVPFVPRLTTLLFPRTIHRNREVWDGLGFVTARRLVRLAAQNGLSAVFASGTMTAFIDRLETDPIFASRHKGFLLSMLRAFQALGLMNLLRRLPPRLQTPMIVTFSRR